MHDLGGLHKSFQNLMHIILRREASRWLKRISLHAADSPVNSTFPNMKQVPQINFQPIIAGDNDLTLAMQEVRCNSAPSVLKDSKGSTRS
jgi:hypothetical protein